MSFFPVSVSLLIFGCFGTSAREHIIDVKCGSCHTADVVYEQKRSRAEWDILVTGMKVRGLKLTGGEEKQIKEILYNKLGNGK